MHELWKHVGYSPVEVEKQENLWFIKGGPYGPYKLELICEPLELNL